MDKQQRDRLNRIYREPIVIEKRVSDSQNETGSWTQPKWVPWRIVHANIKNLHGQEYFVAGQTNQQNTVKFVMRFIPGVNNEVKTEYRIRYRNHIYDIDFVDNIRYEDEELEIKAMERNITNGAI